MLYPEPVLAFQDRVRRREICFGVHHSAMSPQLVELYGHLGLDFVMIGTEVESLDLGRMEDLLRAADASRTLPIVKVRRPSVSLIGDLMNIGASILMVPHVTTRAQLDTLVRASRFAPEGLRGECPVARYNGFGSGHLSKARESMSQIRSIVPIIEDAEALENLDELLSCPDVDMFEIGPLDLSASLGEPGRGYDSPRIMGEIERIAEVAEKYGKALGAPLSFPLRTTSMKEIINWQMEELIARGITVLYASEVQVLVEAVVSLSVLRKVRVVEDAPAQSEADGGAPQARAAAGQ